MLRGSIQEALTDNQKVSVGAAATHIKHVVEDSCDVINSGLGQGPQGTPKQDAHKQGVLLQHDCPQLLLLLTGGVHLAVGVVHVVQPPQD